MYIVPISEVLTAAMGSITQCAVPLGLAAYFWYWRRDHAAAAACAVWSATNFQDVSVYIADAPRQELQLLGGTHDWATILGPGHFDRLAAAQSIANVTRAVGLIVLCVVVVGAFRAVLDAGAPTGSGSATGDPDVPRAARSDDLFPSR
jgi:hypothetical protein